MLHPFPVLLHFLLHCIRKSPRSVVCTSSLQIIFMHEVCDCAACTATSDHNGAGGRGRLKKVRAAIQLGSLAVHGPHFLAAMQHIAEATSYPVLVPASRCCAWCARFATADPPSRQACSTTPCWKDASVLLRPFLLVFPTC